MAVSLGINIASLAYLCPGTNHLFATPNQLIKLAREIGFDFVMALPLRGATGQEEPAEYIRFYEEAWNPGTIWDSLCRRFGPEGPPRLHDILLFPSPEQCWEVSEKWLHRGVERVDHDFSRASLVEVSPRLDMEPMQILQCCRETGARLVIDTSHLQRNYRADEILVNPSRAGKPSPLGLSLDDWLAAIDLWAPVLAPVMHLNVDAQAFANVREGNARLITRRWLKATAGLNQQVIMEFRPSWKSRANSEAVASLVLREARYMLDQMTEGKWFWHD